MPMLPRLFFSLPTWRDIGELAAIAVIRTFLNYFLERDLENSEPAEASTA